MGLIAVRLARIAAPTAPPICCRQGSFRATRFCRRRRPVCGVEVFRRLRRREKGDTSAGVLECTALRPRGSGGASGNGAVVTVTFLAKSTGLSRLTVADANVVHPDGQVLAIPATEMSVTVQ